MSLDAFNDVINSHLEPIFGNAVLAPALKLFLVVYSALVAPKLPASMATVFTHTGFRIAYFAMVVWLFTHDPAVAILTAVAYMVTLHFLLKKSLTNALTSGVVTPDLAALVTGGSGITIKPGSVVQTEVQNLQKVLNTLTAPGYVGTPKAGTDQSDSVSGVFTTPSGTPATHQGMMDTNQPDHPQAFVPDSLVGFADLEKL